MKMSTANFFYFSVDLGADIGILVSHMKQMFFKVVRKNGDSVWAIGRFKQNYQIGKRYRFTKQSPAHVFIPDAPWTKMDSIYSNRPEGYAGSRVLICYGETERRKVACFDINGNWNLNTNPAKLLHKIRNVSTDFTVIGELIPNNPDLTENKPARGRVIERRKSTKFVFTSKTARTLQTA